LLIVHRVKDNNKARTGGASMILYDLIVLVFS
jgi:hypothetical protein